MTANAIPEDRARRLAAGMDAYLPKPVTLTALRGVLARRCGSGVPARGGAPGKGRGRPAGPGEGTSPGVEPGGGREPTHASMTGTGRLHPGRLSEREGHPHPPRPRGQGESGGARTALDDAHAPPPPGRRPARAWGRRARLAPPCEDAPARRGAWPDRRAPRPGERREETRAPRSRLPLRRAPLTWLRHGDEARPEHRGANHELRPAGSGKRGPVAPHDLRWERGRPEPGAPHTPAGRIRQRRPAARSGAPPSSPPGEGEPVPRTPGLRTFSPTLPGSPPDLPPGPPAQSPTSLPPALPPP